MTSPGLKLCWPLLLAGCAVREPTNLPITVAPALAAPASSAVVVKPVRGTDPVTEDADDPAVWVHPQDPSRSWIIGTNKIKAPGGALVVFGLDGRIHQTVSGLDRPNNVDVEYGFDGGGKRLDLAVVAERRTQSLRIYRVGPTGLSEIGAPGGTRVFAGESDDRAACMGVALYRRPADGAVFAIVSRKDGPDGRYLGQYRLMEDGGRVVLNEVRRFGAFRGGQEIEAVCVDDALGFVYYSDETYGIHKYHADPDHAAAGEELAVFGREGFAGDHEGIGLYRRADGTGYLLCSDQIKGGSELHVYPREGLPGSPHQHPLLKVLADGADDTDGLEVVSCPLGRDFPHGLVVAMNSGPRNFLLYDWDALATTGEPALAFGQPEPLR